MNIKVSDRVADLQESVTLAITAKAKAMKAEGKDVIGFAAGEPDFDTPDNIKAAAIRAIEGGATKYTPVGGTDDLKEVIIDKFRVDNKLEYSKPEILVSCGGKHSFYNLCQALLNSGDEVVIPAPYWVSYPPMVELAGGTPVIVSTDESTNFKITPGALRSAITTRTRAVVLNSPSNPTGSVYSAEELELIGEVVKEAGILVITDEIYEKLVYDGKVATSIASLPAMKDHSVVLNGVSKTYSMTGWRIGYAAGPEALIKAMTKIQSQSTSNPTSISQAAAVEAIGGPQDIIEVMGKEFSKRRNMLVEGLNAIDGISCLLPEGAFYVFPNVSGLYGRTFKGKKIEGSLDVAAYLIEEAGVAVVPGVAFGADSNVRISYAIAEESIVDGLGRIARAFS